MEVTLARRPPALERLGYSVELVAHLVAREFRLRYERRLFGWVWAIGQPLMRLIVLSFLFTRILPLDIPNYPVFLFAGLMGWAWFASGVSSATSCAVDRRDLLHRPGLPRATLPIVSVVAGVLDYMAALPVLLVFLVLSDGIPMTAFAIPVVLLPQLLLTIGLGLALCPANVHLRDTRLLVDLVLTVGFYITPVFYRESALLDRFGYLFDSNPMARLLAMQREVLVFGRLPGLDDYLGLMLVCATVTCLGYAIFRSTSPTLIDEL